MHFYLGSKCRQNIKQSKWGDCDIDSNTFYITSIQVNLVLAGAQLNQTQSWSMKVIMCQFSIINRYEMGDIIFLDCSCSSETNICMCHVAVFFGMAIFGVSQRIAFWPYRRQYATLFRLETEAFLTGSSAIMEDECSFTACSLKSVLQQMWVKKQGCQKRKKLFLIENRRNTKIMKYLNDLQELKTTAGNEKGLQLFCNNKSECSHGPCLYYSLQLFFPYQCSCKCDMRYIR